MKVGLVHPRTENQAKSDLIWPPLGLCRIARFLRDRGHEVSVIEDALDRPDLDQIIGRASGMDFVGFGAMTLQAPRVEYLLSCIRQTTGAVLVCGGPHYSATQKLAANCDALVVGDGELAFLEIIGGKRGLVAGRQSQEYIEADFSFVDYPRYGDHLIDGTRAISLLTSRGCPFGCRFCGSPKAFGRSVTYYPLQEVVSNMSRLSSKYGFRAFRIMDDTFTLNNRRVIEFCDLVSPFGWRMSCLTNVRTVRAATLQRMRSAGFEFVAIGAESANEAVLKLANKRQSQEDIRRAVAMINDAGLKAEVLFIIGLPGETVGSLSETISLAKELKAYRVHAQFFTPFPGCEFHDQIERFGTIIERDYNKWTHRVPVFVPHSISYDVLLSLANEFFSMLGRTVGK